VFKHAGGVYFTSSAKLTFSASASLPRNASDGVLMSGCIGALDLGQGHSTQTDLLGNDSDLPRSFRRAFP
jgi:hypothetical protein